MKTFFLTAGAVFLIILYFSYIGVLPKFYNFGAEDTEEREETISQAEKLRLEQRQKLEELERRQKRLMEDRQRKLREYRDRH